MRRLSSFKRMCKRYAKDLKNQPATPLKILSLGAGLASSLYILLKCKKHY